jgi:hypothetical protein
LGAGGVAAQRVEGEDGKALDRDVVLALDAVLNLAPDQGRRKGQGQKGHFIALLSPQKPEINISLGGVSISKFVKNLLLQIALFCMSSSKAWSLCVSRSKFSLTCIT